MASQDIVPIRARISIVRAAFAGAITLAVLFVLCWIGAATNVIAGSHMYISLFTLAPAPSTTALAAGVGWSLVFGAITGALLAGAYNCLGFIDRR